jgi:predicted NUDIX family NTP pyrophosphohydrolase
MYQVFINDRILQFTPLREIVESAEIILKLTGFESSIHLEQIVQSFEVHQATDHIVLQSADIDRTWETFCSLYQVLEAAGGVVYNLNDEMLLIFRNGKWDLPKGKIEAGEDPDQAAIREVNEECGIGYLELEKQIATTYHTYPYQGKKVLKKTFWFSMKTKDTSQPIPQLEEGIIDAKWMSRQGVAEVLENTYSSIGKLLKDQLNGKPTSYLG